MAEIAAVNLLNTAQEDIGAAPTYEDVHVRIRLKVRKAGTALRGVVDVHAKGVFLFRTVQPEETVVERRGVVDLIVRLPAHLLAETAYLLNVTVYTRLEDKDMKVVLDNALTFIAYGDRGAPVKSGVRSGVIAPRLSWHTQSHLSARRLAKAAKSLV
jgi:hypothetical protein